MSNNSNMGLDIEQVRAYYQSMPDAELIRIVTQDAYGLTDEAIQISKDEVKRRGLRAGLIDGLDAQHKEYTMEEISSYADVLANLPCPGCNSTANRLNATLAGEVVSFIIMTNYRKELVIGCPGCLDKANNKALAKTLLLGWWGLPWGVIRTIQSTLLNFRSKSSNHLPEHNDLFLGFTLQHIGEIVAHKDDRKALGEVIKRVD